MDISQTTSVLEQIPSVTLQQSLSMTAVQPSTPSILSQLVQPHVQNVLTPLPVTTQISDIPVKTQNIFTRKSRLRPELEFMPVRCYACRKVVRQQAIEKSLLEGVSLKETMDKLKYGRICCRMVIMEAPVIVDLQKQIEEQQKTEEVINTLTISNTGPHESFNTTLTPKHNIQILDDVPPGSDFGICFTGVDEMLMEDGIDIEDAYGISMKELGLTESK